MVGDRHMCWVRAHRRRRRTAEVDAPIETRRHVAVPKAYPRVPVRVLLP